MNTTHILTDMKTIMVADDNKAILDVMTLILEGAGYTVLTTEHGGDLRKLPSPLPDLLFLDISLSGEDGVELCRHLKDDERTKNLPVLLFSAKRDLSGIAESSGANGFVFKPFEVSELLEKVRQYI